MEIPWLLSLQGGLVVSCQALAHEPLHSPDIMARMAVAANDGGAAAIRANSPVDIAAIKAAVELPVIGLYKDGSKGVFITPTRRHVSELIAAGANMIAMDGTGRPRPNGETLAELFDTAHTQGIPVMADVSTFDEGVAAAELGADVVATTLSGYTDYSLQQRDPDFELITRLNEALDIPIFAEGRIATPAQAKAALDAGAFAVVVGGAITRPQQITRTFVEGLS
ncbi:MAG: putative N-acetylmannosamine-6-phosphate epimerase [Kiritimatiellia bacterium]|jgi:N-acylglucosamine-6-phosphate 2-epimerase